MAKQSTLITVDGQSGGDQQPAPVRIGLVGCGFATEQLHLPRLSRMAEFRVEAVADVDADALTRVAQRFGVPRRYGSVRELAADPSVEAVAVCVPAAVHSEAALAAMDAGKHLFVEKPLALSLDEADRLLERERESRLMATVGFNLRCHRLVRSARELLRAGAIGTVSSVASAFEDARPAPPGPAGWRLRRVHGGGALVDKAIHHMDLWRFLLDDEVEEVSAFTRPGKAEDETIVISARMRGGALVTHGSSNCTVTRNELTLSGDGGALHIDCYRSDGLVVVGPAELPGAPRTRLRRILSSGRQLQANLGEIRHGGAFEASYEAEWRAFARSVRGGEAPVCSLEDGRRALQVALAAAHSTSVHEPVRVADAPSVLAPGAPLPGVAGR